MRFSCDACYDRGIGYTAFWLRMRFSCDACYDRGIRYTAFWLKCFLDDAEPSLPQHRRDVAVVLQLYVRRTSRPQAWPSRVAFFLAFPQLGGVRVRCTVSKAPPAEEPRKKRKKNIAKTATAAFVRIFCREQEDKYVLTSAVGQQRHQCSNDKIGLFSGVSLFFFLSFLGTSTTV